MAPKIEVSDDEVDDIQDEISRSESEELSDVELDDDDADVQDEDVDEDEEEDDEDNDNGLDLDDFESEEAYQPETAAPTRPLRGNRPVRETRRRQLTFYDEDDLESEEERAPPAKKVSVKLKIPRWSAASVDAVSEEELAYKPDVLRMTERQRAKLEEDPSEKYEELTFAKMDEQLLALNRKTQKKKETAEQMAVRKAENARRRAHYKTKQLEEEKRDTLNKLLKRRATKTREKAVDDSLETKQTLKPRRPTLEHPALSRWVCNREGSVFAVAE